MITARGLTKFYGDKRAIEDLSFEIESGEIIGILGLNGAGKTTTLRILASLLLPSTGTVTIGGVDVVEHPHQIRKMVGFLPEESPLYREMTVEAFLTFSGELRGLTRAEARQRLEQVLDVTSIADVRGEVIDNLSFGFRKRVGIAQAIIHQPPVLILDEPITGLDPVQIVEMRQMIRGLGGKHTVLVSSHILPEISQTCDRLLVIQDGHLVGEGTEEQLTGQLGGAHRVKLLVRGDEAQTASALRGLEHVTEFQVVNRTEDQLLLRVVTDADVREQIARALIKADVGLLHLGPAEAELESVFLQLTSQKEVSR